MATLAYRRGIEMGISEAKRAASLLDRNIGYVVLSAGRLQGSSSGDPLGRRVHALIAPIEDGHALGSLGEWASRSRVPVVALGPVADARCAPFVFRISPPPTRDAATVLARAAQSDSSGHHSSGDARIEIAFWHPSLERFGAAQLSDRFRAEYGIPMTSEAWAGWMAVKIIWESSLRAAAAPGGLRDAIARAASDGHKGRALRFGPDNILRHPLVIVRSGAASGGSASLVAEVDWPDSVATNAGAHVGTASLDASGGGAPSATGHACGDA